MNAEKKSAQKSTPVAKTQHQHEPHDQEHRQQVQKQVVGVYESDKIFVEVTACDGLFNGKSQNRQRVIVTNHGTFIDIEEIGNGCTPLFTLSYHFQVDVFRDVRVVVPVYQSVGQTGEIAGSSYNQNDNCVSEPAGGQRRF